MQLAHKASLGLALVAGLGLSAVRPAAASHEKFLNVAANGVALTPVQDNATAVNNITLVGNVLTITTDYNTPGTINRSDALNFLFTQTGGTSATPANISPVITFTPATQTLTEMFTLTGTFLGNLHMGTNNSSPDYSSPGQGYFFNGADFNLNLTPGGTTAVPEPSSVASMGLGGLGLLGLLLRARKRRTAA